ncbi:NDxxF motif lipoprotein [Mammaliicoccus sciuri]|uniref:NDxxF motif lipoprotein n=1 Tax=Mammaliicoccus sciuri TaxID=1296 RepID=UPI0037BDFC38
MKRNFVRLLIGTISLLMLILLTACGNDTEANKKVDKYSFKKTNEKISEKNMKSQIESYLDSNESILKGIEKLEGQDTAQQIETIDTVKKQLGENNRNFENLIKKNNIPESYSEANKVLEYFNQTNNLLGDFKKNLSDVVNKKDYSKLKNIITLSSKYDNELNGYYENELKQFIKEKGIDSNLFEQKLFNK